MAIQLTTDYTIGAGRRVIFVRVRPDEDAQVLQLDVELRTAVASDLVVSRKTIFVRNGNSDKLQRATLAAGQVLEDALQVVPGGAATPTGYTDAMTAWRSGATPAARRAALEAHALTAAWYDISLVGT